jgi:UDPglucose--hexose-1-phosphate uridylyltransferase
MSELRFNLISREWVVVATKHPRNPADFRTRGNAGYVPEHDPSCPFCPGNEFITPNELLRIPPGAGGADWRVRVTPNKFAIFRDKGERERSVVGLKRVTSAVGRHEIIVETPRHDLSLGLLEVDHVREILGVYRERFIQAYSDDRVHNVIIYKNHGSRAGTNILHPHTQLVGAPVVPSLLRMRVDEAMRYHESTGQCMLCATLADEGADGTRVIMDSPHFISFLPFAALSPFHIWIFPKRHEPSFAHTTDEEMADLASVLKLTLQKIHAGADNPNYNMVIRSVSPLRRRSEYLHWYISIMAHVTTATGFELGSGMYVNPTSPEVVAEYLRKVRLT